MTVRFNGRDQRHRFQMLQLIHALSLEITSGVKYKINFFHHAKSLGWIDKDVRTRKQALKVLVGMAVTGFGYVPKDRIKTALRPVRRITKSKVAA